MIIEIEKHISVDVYTNRKKNLSFSTYFIFESLSFHSSAHSKLAKNCTTCIPLDEATDIDRNFEVEELTHIFQMTIPFI